MNYIILKRARVILALSFFLFTSFSFIDLYELFPESITSKIFFLQFAPSLLRFAQILNLTSIGFFIVIILSFFFGRIYCSTVCPLGILQDFFSFLAKRKNKKKVFYKFKKSFPIVRFGLLAVTILSFLAGTSLIINLLDPYSNAGRIFTYNIKPIFVWINNVASHILQNQKIYTLHLIEKGETPILITLYVFSFFILIAYLSFKRGRLFCNLICPVGTFLSLLSKKSVYKVNFNDDNCTKCGKCASSCKSECIDLKHQKIDYSRCVVCFNCLQACNDNALNFTAKTSQKVEKTFRAEKTINRRNAITTLLTLTTSSSILSQNRYQHRKGSRIGKNREYQLAISEYAVTPPGSKGIERFNSLCTACGLCISACPTNVLQPAIKEYGLIGFMQPHLDYTHTGFCNFDCNRCSEICPTGAILPLAIEEKKITQLGKAVFIKKNCVVHRDGNDCGACSEHCPTKSVDMVPYRNGLVIPQVNQDICIGCGACEHACPVEYPHKAIYVESNPIHVLAQKPDEEQNIHQTIEEDFPF